MKFKQKSSANHKYNNGNARKQTRKVFYMLTAIMIFMNAIVCVNTAAMPTRTTTLLSATRAAAIVTYTATSSTTAVAATMARTLASDTNRNPIIGQQSSKTLPPQMPPPTFMSNSATASVSTNTSCSLASNNTSCLSSFSSSSSPSIAMEVNDNSQPLSMAVNTNSCKSLTGTWGDVDPNIYYICDMQTKQPLPLRCPEGRGYFNGFGYTGCIPYDDWPACVKLYNHEQVHICDTDHMEQPWETMNPNKFYICLQETIEPMLLNCGQGKGFVHVLVNTSGNNETGSGRGGGGGAVDAGTFGATSEIVGCTNWEKWRSYMQCTDYY